MSFLDFETQTERAEFFADLVARTAAAREAEMLATMARASEAKASGDTVTARALLQMAAYEDWD